MTNPATVGVVGLGKMGSPMALHLRHKGNEVLVFDVNRDAVDALKPSGCTSAYQLSDLHDQCDLVFIIVSFDYQVEAVCQGADGFFANNQKPVTLVVCSTIEPETMTRLAEAAPAHVRLVDAPLCRGEISAGKGELLGLMGGDKKDCEAVRPHLAAFCSDIDYIGPLGSGQVAKALNNFILWASISVNHEAFKLGKHYGLDQETLRQALLKSSGQNWAMSTWNQPRTMPWAEKDMRIILNMADRHNLPLTMAGFIKEHIKLVKDEWGLYDKS